MKNHLNQTKRNRRLERLQEGGAHNAAAVPARQWRLQPLAQAIKWALGASVVGLGALSHGVVLAANNGVPVLNIEAPNAKGVSHNRLQSLDVSRPGMIFNNSLQDGVSQIGGDVSKNPLLAGRPASAIIAEVTGSSPSRLQGVLEVFGQRADLIIANPNGIEVNGLSTVNARGLGLITGSSVDGSNFNVRGGTLSVVGDGIDLKGLDYADLVARKVRLAGAVGSSDGSAKTDVLVLAGSNDYNVNRGYRYAGDGKEAPQLDIDGSAAGSLYAGRVRLVVTAAGAGVRQLGQVHAAEDVQVSANGELQVGAISAGGALALTGGNVRSDGGLQAGAGAAIASRGVLELGGSGLAAKGDTAIAAASLFQQQGASITVGSRDGHNGNLTINVAGDHTLVGGAPRGGAASQIQAAGNIVLNAGTLTNKGARIVSGGDMELRTTGQLRNEGEITGNGKVRIDAGELTLDVVGNIVSRDTLDITVSGALDSLGGMLATNDLTVRAGKMHVGTANITNPDVRAIESIVSKNGNITLDVKQGFHAERLATIAAGKDLTVRAGGDVLLEEVKLTAQGNGTVAAGGNFRSIGSTLSTTRGDLSISGATLVQEGVTKLKSGKDMRLAARGDIRTLDGVQVTAAGVLELTAGGAIRNGGFGESGLLARNLARQIKINAGGDFTNEGGGYIFGLEGLEINAANIRNGGDASSLLSGGDVKLTASGEIRNALGAQVDSGGKLQVKAAIVKNEGRAGGAVATMHGKQIDITAGTFLRNAEFGRLAADVGMRVTAAQIENAGAAMDAGTGMLEIDGSGKMTNGAGGQMRAQSVKIVAGDVENQGTIAAAASSLVFTTGKLRNLAGGTISAAQNHLWGNIINARGAHIDGSNVVLEGTLDNDGTARANDTLQFMGSGYVNRGSLVAGGSASVYMKGGASLTLDANNHLPLSQGYVGVSTNNFYNNGVEQAAGKLSIFASGTIVNRGVLSSRGDLKLDARGVLSNEAGAVLTAGGSAILMSGEKIANERGAQIAAQQDLTLMALKVTNEAGADIAAGRDLNLETALLENKAITTHNVKRGPNETNVSDHKDYHDLRLEFYRLSIDVPTIEVETNTVAGRIRAGRDIQMNQLIYKNSGAIIKDTGGIFQAGRKMVVDGQWQRQVASGLNTRDLLDARVPLAFDVQPWTLIGTQLDFKGTVRFASWRELLQAMLSKPNNPGTQIADIIFYKWYPAEIMEMLAKVKTPQASRLLDEVLGADWRKLSFKDQCARWAAFRDHDIKP